MNLHLVRCPVRLTRSDKWFSFSASYVHFLSLVVIFYRNSSLIPTTFGTKFACWSVSAVGSCANECLVDYSPSVHRPDVVHQFSLQCVKLGELCALYWESAGIGVCTKVLCSPQKSDIRPSQMAGRTRTEQQKPFHDFFSLMTRRISQTCSGVSLANCFQTSVAFTRSRTWLDDVTEESQLDFTPCFISVLATSK